MRTRAHTLLAIAVLASFACAPRGAEAPPIAYDEKPAAADYTHPGWKALIDAARTEGRVVVAATPNPELRVGIPELFRERFGIEIEYVMGRGGEIVNRLEVERAAGLSTVDVAITGGDSATRMYQEGWLEPIRPVLVAPGVADPARWVGNRLPFVDPDDQTILQLERSPQGFWLVNPQLVQESELRSLDDLLDPKWKGKISMDDPSGPGLGQNNAVYIYLEKGEDFFRKLYVEQAPVVSRDDRQLEDWLVKGVHPITFGLAAKNVQQLQAQGLPIKDIGTLAGKGWVRGPSVAYFTNAPHPNAAKLFLNWIASPEGMRAHALAEQLAPLRTDVDAPWTEGKQVQDSAAYTLNADDLSYVTTKKPPIMARIREIIRG